MTSSTDGPHTATANVTVVIDAGLTILKTASPTSVTAGVGGYSYQITVTNTGPSDAQTVSVVDTLPVGFTATAYDQAGVSPVAPTAGPFTWTIGTLAAGTSKVLNVTYSVGAGVTAGVKTNSATVTSSTDGPHTATANVTVATAAKLEITKTPDIQLVTAGDGIVYTYLITVMNTGSSDAHNVSVVDTWPGPAGSLVQGAFAPSQGSITNQDAAGNFTWLVGTLPSGKATLTVNYTVPATTPTQTFTNTVVASSDETDPNNKPTASAVTEVSNPIIPTAGEGVAVLGTDDGCPVPPVVRVVDKFGTIVSFFDSTNGLYEPGFKGSVRVTSGDITGDGIADIIVAPGRGRVGQIRAFIASGTGVSTVYTYDSRYDTLPFGATWRSGVEVAVGDVNGDGIGDIIAGQSRGAGLVRAFLVGDPSSPDPVANTPYRSFRGYPPTYAGGVMVASADLTGDGKAEIIVGNNAGMRSKVRVFDVTGTPTVIRTILPFTSKYRGGVTLSVGRYDGDSVNDIFIGAGVLGQSNVEIYSGATGAQLARLTAFSSFTKSNARTFTAGVDLTGSGQVDTLYGVKGLNGSGGAKGVRQYNVATQVTSPLTSDPALAPPLRIAPIPRPVLQAARRR